jgi:hypothetical protein
MRMKSIRQVVAARVNTHSVARLVSLMIVTLLLSACAATQTNDNGIEERAQARWDALLAKDYATAYSFYSPGYRSSTTVVDFEISQRVRRVTWIDAKVGESSCTADVCTISTLATHRVVRPVPGITAWENDNLITEQWVRSNGEWWFVPKE